MGLGRGRGRGGWWRLLSLIEDGAVNPGKVAVLGFLFLSLFLLFSLEEFPWLCVSFASSVRAKRRRLFGILDGMALSR